MFVNFRQQRKLFSRFLETDRSFSTRRFSSSSGNVGSSFCWNCSTKVFLRPFFSSRIRNDFDDRTLPVVRDFSFPFGWFVSNFSSSDDDSLFRNDRWRQERTRTILSVSTNSRNDKTGFERRTERFCSTKQTVFFSVLIDWFLFSAEEIFKRLNSNGFVFMDKQTRHLSKEVLNKLYSRHRGLPWFNDFIQYMNRFVHIPKRYTPQYPSSMFQY